jgi:hypothetical protein
MSHAEYASRPIPVFAKLGVFLRNIPAVQFVLAKFATLLRSSKADGETQVSQFVDEAPLDGATLDGAPLDRSPLDGAPGVTEQADDFAGAGEGVVAAPESNDTSDREQLVRRRWAETGIKMWNGRSALNIQGSAKLLPAKPGETLPRYDTLEYRLIAGQIVCEGVVLDPPKPRK